MQFFASHGNIDNITYKNSGIRVGSTKNYGTLEYIGTNDVNMWNNNTILTTYAGCYTAGDGALDANSITYQTALKGATVAVGFTEEIYPSSLESWARRYNNRLASGYGVLDSVNYANSFTYVYNSVKNNVIVNHGNANEKIGMHHISLRPIENSILALKDVGEKRCYNIKVDNVINEDKIDKELKKINNEFNKENYEISQRESESINIETHKTEKTKYIDYKFKIGDYITEAGYTIEISNDNTIKLYDNNIDLEKQKQVLIQKEKYKKDKVNEKEIKNKAKQQVQQKYSLNDNITVDDMNTVYYYDIKNDKKLILISVKTENHLDGSVGYAYDTISYQVDN